MADHEEPTLPAYPCEIEDYETSLPSKRKRSYASHMFSDSSEPAIFSSDNDPAAENYVQGPRQKKQYCGTWDHQQPLDVRTVPSKPSDLQHGTRRKFEAVDSGVFMGSDSMDESPEPPPPAPSRLSQFTVIRAHLRGGNPPPRKPEAEALRVIERCVNEGDEIIDLSNMSLKEISNDSIRKLREVVPIPQVSRDVSFTQPEPQLKLFLSNNHLTRCPGQIFNLENLTVLSLRGNGLTEIPPAIFQLTNLTQLNVSLNALKYLPVELLELLYNTDSKLTALNLHPNPFHKPTGVSPQTIEDWPRHTQHRPRWLSKPPFAAGFHAWLVARTPVQFRGGPRAYIRQWGWQGDSDHLINSASQQSLELEDVDIVPEFPSSAEPTKVFSLQEHCLQTIPLKYPAYTDWFEHVGNPEIIKVLEEMDDKCEAGVNICTVCRRKVIRPTAQWIEWYELYGAEDNRGVDITAPTPGNNETDQVACPRTMSPLSKNPDEQFVPFLRQACTWACVSDSKRGLGKTADPS